MRIFARFGRERGHAVDPLPTTTTFNRERRMRIEPVQDRLDVGALFVTAKGP
jgi:hypothetical protein